MTANLGPNWISCVVGCLLHCAYLPFICKWSKNDGVAPDFDEKSWKSWNVSQNSKKPVFWPLFHKLLEVFEPAGPIYSPYPGVPPGKWSKMMKKPGFRSFPGYSPFLRYFHELDPFLDPLFGLLRLFIKKRPLFVFFYREMPLRFYFRVSENVSGGPFCRHAPLGCAVQLAALMK